MKIRVFSLSTSNEKDCIFSESFSISRKSFESLSYWIMLHNKNANKQIGTLMEFGDSVSGKVATKEEVQKEVKYLTELEDRYK